jgi:hypothetical protein
VTNKNFAIGFFLKLMNVGANDLSVLSLAIAFWKIIPAFGFLNGLIIM